MSAFYKKVEGIDENGNPTTFNVETFNEDNFTYDEEKHLGYYKGELVPSVTQLVDLVYPMSENIPLDRIQNAADKGSELHEALLIVNSIYYLEPTIKEVLDDILEYCIKDASCLEGINGKDMEY